MSEIVVIKGANRKPISDERHQVITFETLKIWVKTGAIWRHLWRYDRATLAVYRLETVARPFLMALILRCMSRGAVIIEADNGQSQRISIGGLFKFVRQAITDYLGHWHLIRRHQKRLDHLTTLPRSSHPNLDKPPLYLRTDMAFGRTAGGSVAHISGILNAMTAPIFITTDTIPHVNTAIPQNRVPLPPRYWDFPEWLTLAANDAILNFTENHLKNHSIGFIYHRYSLNNYVGVELAQRYNLPLVLEYNGSEVWIHREWWGKNLNARELAEQIEWLNCHAATVISVVSDALKDDLVQRGVNAKKILVNPNGVDPHRYSPDIDASPIRQKYNLINQTVIGFIGTFGAWHGVEVLAQAFGIFLKNHPEYQNTTRLLLIGDGEKMPLVQHHLAAYQVSDVAILSGKVPQSDGASYLAACDILVSPNISNPDGTPFFSSPIKLFEYMAMGKAIIASDLPPLRRVLKHEQNALLVPPNDPHALAKTLKALIDNPSQRNQLGKQARTDALAHHTWDQNLNRILDKLTAQHEH